MLIYLWHNFFADFKIFNILKYITFRSFGAIITSIILCLLTAQPFINFLKKIQKNGQPIRTDGPLSHLSTKQGTPTMGGVLILFSLFIDTLIWSDLNNNYIWIVMFATLGFGIIGGIDDFKKLKRNNHKGLSGRFKMLFQLIIAILSAYFFQNTIGNDNIFFSINIPFAKDLIFNLGGFFYIWICFVIIGSSNAVNLTDGLDGLAIVPVMICSFCFFIICYVSGNALFSKYLQIIHVKNLGEVCIFLSALIGTGLGFLWYNAPPAKVFMGDTGSLAIGGALGVISMLSKHEIVLAIIGGVFVIEAISVIIQVFSYKTTRKRVFLMAPIHHHFEQKGWSESTIVIRFWIVSAIFALIGLSSLKLR